MKILNTIFTLICCMTLLQSHAETPGRYRIKGIMANSSYDGSCAILNAYDPYDDLTVFSDTTVVKDGVFYFEGEANPDLGGQVFLGGAMYNAVTVILDEGDITAEISFDTDIPSRVTGSLINDRYQLYRDSIRYYGEEIDRNLTDENRIPNGITIKDGTKIADIYAGMGNMTRNFKRENISNAAGKIALFEGLKHTLSELILVQD